MRRHFLLVGSLVGSLAGCAFQLDPPAVPLDGNADGPHDAETVIDAVPDASSCPADFGVVAGAPATSRYKIYGWSVIAADNRATSWDAAAATCVAQASHLAIVDHVAERDALLAVIPRNSAVLSLDQIWNGITDAAVELQWMTVLGAIPTWAVWGANEGPNKGGPDPAQNCATVYAPGLWGNDAACGPTYSFPFACECEL